MFVPWVLAGLLAGWLAGVAMKREGYGLRGDSILGLAGSLVGGGTVWLAVSPDAGMTTVALIAFGGAVVLIVLQRKTWPAIA